MTTDKEAAMTVSSKPEGYHTVTPYLVVKGAGDVIEFAKQAFGAEEVFRMAAPDGGVAHAEIRIGDSMVMLSDGPMNDDQAWFPAMLHLYVDDVDTVYERALAAGATSVREPADQFYGDRSGGVSDSAGNQWWIATHVEDVAPDELERRVKALEAQGGGPS